MRIYHPSSEGTQLLACGFPCGIRTSKLMESSEALRLLKRGQPDDIPKHNLNRSNLGKQNANRVFKVNWLKCMCICMLLHQNLV